MSIVETLKKDLGISLIKPDYEKQRFHLKRKQEIIDIHIEEMKEYELLIYGKEGSMFYGIKTPSLFKILEYMVDEYNIPYDVMFDMIYHNVMKIYYKKHFDNVFRHHNWDNRFIRGREDKKRCQYLRRVYPHDKQDKSKHLYLGDIKYESDGFGVVDLNIVGKKWSCVSCKGKKHFLDRYGINANHFKLLDKKQIIEQLNKLGIKFKLSDTKEKLMRLLIKNEPSGLV